MESRQLSDEKSKETDIQNPHQGHADTGQKYEHWEGKRRGYWKLNIHVQHMYKKILFLKFRMIHLIPTEM